RAAVSVDATVHVLVADPVPALALEVPRSRVVAEPSLASEGPLAGAAFDPAEPLDVDVGEFARARALVANRLLEPELAEPAQSASGEDPRHRRDRHAEQLGDLGTGEAQPPHRDDQPDPLLRRPVGDAPRPRRAIEQAALAFEPVPADPLARAADADPGGLGRRRQRPTLADHPLGQPPPTAPTERRVTVKPHPDLLLGAESAWQPSASKEARMDQPAQELHLAVTRHQGTTGQGCELPALPRAQTSVDAPRRRPLADGLRLGDGSVRALRALATCPRC